MARNRQHEAREAADEGVKAAEEIGANILTLSARAAEQSVNGFSRLLGLGQNTEDVKQQSQRGMEVMQSLDPAFGHRVSRYVEGIHELGAKPDADEHEFARQIHAMPHAGSASRLLQSVAGENIALALALNGRLAEISKEVVDRTAERITEVAEQTQQAKKQAA